MLGKPSNLLFLFVVAFAGCNLLTDSNEQSRKTAGDSTYEVSVALANRNALPAGTQIHLISYETGAHIVKEVFNSDTLIIGNLTDDMRGRSKVVTTSPGRRPIINNYVWPRDPDWCYPPQPLDVLFGVEYSWIAGDMVIFGTWDTLSIDQAVSILPHVPDSILSDGTMHYVWPRSATEVGQFSDAAALDPRVYLVAPASVDFNLSSGSNSGISPVIEANLELGSVCEVLDAFVAEFPDLKPVWRASQDNEAVVVFGLQGPSSSVSAAVQWLRSQPSIGTVDDLRQPVILGMGATQ